MTCKDKTKGHRDGATHLNVINGSNNNKGWDTWQEGPETETDAHNNTTTMFSLTFGFATAASTCSPPLLTHNHNYMAIVDTVTSDHYFTLTSLLHINPQVPPATIWMAPGKTKITTSSAHLAILGLLPPNTCTEHIISRYKQFARPWQTVQQLLHCIPWQTPPCHQNQKQQRTTKSPS